MIELCQCTVLFCDSILWAVNAGNKNRLYIVFRNVHRVIDGDNTSGTARLIYTFG